MLLIVSFKKGIQLFSKLRLWDFLVQYQKNEEHVQLRQQDSLARKQLHILV